MAVSWNFHISIVLLLWRQHIKYRVFPKQESSNMVVGKKEVTVKFYGNWCLPVITWYKQQLWKQAWQITYTITLVYTSLSCISAEVKTLQILFIKSRFSLYMKIFQLMCQLVNLFWKIAIYNAGCVFRLFLWRTEKSSLVKIL